MRQPIRYGGACPGRIGGSLKGTGERRNRSGTRERSSGLGGSSHGTAVCGPACTVVWEGRGREASPYPDCPPARRAGSEFGSPTYCGSDLYVYGKTYLECGRPRGFAREAIRETARRFHIED